VDPILRDGELDLSGDLEGLGKLETAVGREEWEVNGDDQEVKEDCRVFDTFMVADGIRVGLIVTVCSFVEVGVLVPVRVLVEERDLELVRVLVLVLEDVLDGGPLVGVPVAVGVFVGVTVGVAVAVVDGVGVVEDMVP